MPNRKKTPPGRLRDDAPQRSQTAVTEAPQSGSDESGAALAESIATVVREIRERVAELTAREDELAERWKRLADEERDMRSSSPAPHERVNRAPEPSDTDNIATANSSGPAPFSEPSNPSADDPAARTPRRLIRRLLDIRRRERESSSVESQRAWQEVEQAQARLEEQRRALNEQTAEMERRNAELDQRQKALALRLRELAAQENERAKAHSGSSRQRAELSSLAAQLAEERAAMDQRALEVRERHQALEDARQRLAEQEASIAAAEAELQDQREQLQRARAAAAEAAEEVAQRAYEAETRAQEADQRLAELEARDAELERRSQDLDARAAELEAKRAEAAGRRKNLEAAEQALESQRALLAAGEAELADARAGLETQRQALEKAGEEVVAAQAALEAQRRALEDEALTLAKRAGEHEEREQRLAEGQAALEKYRASLRAAAKELKARRDARDSEAAELAARRQAFAREQEQLHAAAAEVASQAEALARGRDELNTRHAALHAGRSRLAKKLLDLRRRAASLEVATAEAAGMIAADLRRERTVLTDERTELHRQREQLRDRAAALDGTEATLRALHEDLARREHALAEQRGEQEHLAQGLEKLQQEHLRAKADADQRSAECAAQRKLLEQQEARLGLELERLRSRESDLANRHEALDQDRRRLEKLEADFDARVTELQNARAQLAEAEQRTELMAQGIEATRAQLDGREFELHQHNLQQQLNQERLDHERDLLAIEADRLASLRDEAESELARLRAALESGRIDVAGLPEFAPRAPVAWWRAFAAASVIGLAAAAAWFAFERPEFRTRAQLVVSGGEAPTVAAAWHAVRLTQPGVLEGLLGDTPRAHMLAAAREVGRLRVRPTANQPSLEITLTSGEHSATEDQLLLRDALEAYCKAERESPRAKGDIARRARLMDLEGRIAAAQATLAERRRALQDMPEAAAFEPALAQFENVRAQLTPLLAELQAARAAANALRSQDRPGGTVDPAVLEAALQSDAILSEDRREFASSVKAYQTELALGMVLVADPARELRQSVNALQAALQEQRLLDPPARIGAALDETSVALDKLDQGLASFLTQWTESREEVERAGAGDADLLSLVDRQGQIAEAARNISAQAQTTVDAANQRVSSLAESGGGTREVVVSSLLRGDLGRMQERVSELVNSAKGVELTHNFKLEAQDRRLRGLRTRMQQREETLRAQCQAQADQQAQHTLLTELEAATEKVAALERQRDELLSRLLEVAVAVYAGGEVMPARQRLQAELESTERELARLTADREALGGAETDGTTAPDSQKPADIERLGATVSAPEQTAGLHRQRNALLAGAGGFVVTLLACLLMLAPSGAHRPAYRPGGTIGELAEDPTLD